MKTFSIFRHYIRPGLCLRIVEGDTIDHLHKRKVKFNFNSRINLHMYLKNEYCLLGSSFKLLKDKYRVQI